MWFLFVLIHKRKAVSDTNLRGDGEMKRIFTQQNIRQTTAILFGCALYAFALDVFLLPREIVIGGVSGIATVLNVKYSLPVGAMIFLINLPLLAMSLIYLGRGSLIRTLLGVVLSSVFTDALSFLPESESDPFVCALLGGACLGGGLGVVFHYGVNTGGTDLAAHLIKKRTERFSMGKLIFIIDALIIFLCAFSLGNFSGIIYSFVATFAIAFSLDASERGMKRSNMLIVVTEHAEELASGLSERVGRGITLLDCTGHYTKERKKMLVCVVRRRELYSAKAHIYQQDPDAFVICADTEAVHGRGFEQ